MTSTPIRILHLATLPDMRAAYDEYLRLVNLYKATFKRAEKVDLFLGTSSEGASIRAHYTSDHEAEAQWFASNVTAVK